MLVRGRTSVRKRTEITAIRGRLRLATNLETSCGQGAVRGTHLVERPRGEDREVLARDVLRPRDGLRTEDGAVVGFDGRAVHGAARLRLLGLEHPRAIDMRV